MPVLERCAGVGGPNPISTTRTASITQFFIMRPGEILSSMMESSGFNLSAR